MSDRHRISAYLTFFETVRLLLVRKVIEFNLVDDLFRNRFFSAIGHPSIQDVALLRDAHAFGNVHDLVEEWHAFLRGHGRPIPPGYRAYLEAQARTRGFEAGTLEPADLPAILALQRAVFDALPSPEWLRENNDEMWTTCLRDHHVVGVRKDGVLVACGVLFDGARGPESIRAYFTTDPTALDQSCNLKVVIVDPTTRTAGIGRMMVELLLNVAIQRGKREVMCTIHPENRPSIGLFSALGFTRLKAIKTTYGRRVAFVLPLGGFRT